CRHCAGSTRGVPQPMKAHRATMLLAAAASLISVAHPAAAQVPDDVVLNIMRECAKIGDATARLACYDNNIRQAGGTPSASARSTTPRSGPAPVAPAPAQTFGLENAPTPRAAPVAPSAPSVVDEIQTRVASITPREPGIYLLTMDDGAQWLFAEGVSSQFRLPRQGDTVEIERGSLGSFLMRIDRQKAVPVRRLR